jgi:hypothetical protein
MTICEIKPCQPQKFRSPCLEDPSTPGLCSYSALTGDLTLNPSSSRQLLTFLGAAPFHARCALNHLRDHLLALTGQFDQGA